MRTKTGKVVSVKSNKTVVVEVETVQTHPKYKKQYTTHKKFHAHDPENKCAEGDTVTIYETKPISKLKRWTVETPKETAKID